MENRTLSPLHDRIIVRPKAVDETSAGGVFIPDGAKGKPSYGEILAVGPGRVLSNGSTTPMPAVNVGDTVLFARYGGHELRFNNETLYILSPDDLYCTRVD